MSVKAFLGRQRAAAIAREIAPHVTTNEAMLDIGSGGCEVAREMIKQSKVDLILLDTFDYNATSLPLDIYDGKKLPYSDKAFSTSSLIFVLHHAENDQALLQEAARVSRKQVLVMEDSPGNAFEAWAWEKMDFAMNHAVHEEVDIAHGTKTAEEWEVNFNEAGLLIASAKQFRSVYTTGLAYPHTLFVLQPES